jgi:ABC-2 type transport system ATP-binding protein
VYDLTVTGTRVRANVEHEGLTSFLAALGGGGLESLTCQPPTLEELFLRHYREELAPVVQGEAPDGVQVGRGPRRGLWGRRSA